MIDEETLRLAARLAAEEAYKLAQGGPLGREVQPAGARIPFESFEIDLSSNGTLDLGGPVRSLVVLDGGHPSVIMRVWGYDGRSRDLDAVAGAGFRDLPVARVQLVVPSGLSGTMRILWADAPGAFEAPGSSGADWTAHEFSSGEDSADNNLEVSLPIGHEYRVLGAYVRCHNDGTAANRVGHLFVRNVGGTNIFCIVRSTANWTAGERGLLACIFGGGDGQSQANNPGLGVNVRFQQVAVPSRALAVVSAPTAAHFEAHIAAGQAGDTAELLVNVLMRPLRGRSAP